MQEIKFNYIILQVRNRALDLFKSSWIVGYKVGTRVQDALHLMLCCAVLCLVALSCPTLCNPMDCSPSGSCVHEDSPGKNTGVVAMPSSRGSSQPRNQTQVFYNAGRFFLLSEPPGKLNNTGEDNLSFLQGIFLTQESDPGVFCIASRFFTI